MRYNRDTRGLTGDNLDSSLSLDDSGIANGWQGFLDDGSHALDGNDVAKRSDTPRRALSDDSVRALQAVEDGREKQKEVRVEVGVDVSNDGGQGCQVVEDVLSELVRRGDGGVGGGRVICEEAKVCVGQNQSVTGMSSWRRTL